MRQLIGEVSTEAGEGNDLPQPNVGRAPSSAAFDVGVFGIGGAATTER